jgi:hypothetical protein
MIYDVMSYNKYVIIIYNNDIIFYNSDIIFYNSVIISVLK